MRFGARHPGTRTRLSWSITGFSFDEADRPDGPEATRAHANACRRKQAPRQASAASASRLLFEKNGTCMVFLHGRGRSGDAAPERTLLREPTAKLDLSAALTHRPINLQGEVHMSSSEVIQHSSAAGWPEGEGKAWQLAERGARDRSFIHEMPAGVAANHRRTRTETSWPSSCARTRSKSTRDGRTPHGLLKAEMRFARVRSALLAADQAQRFPEATGPLGRRFATCFSLCSGTTRVTVAHPRILPCARGKVTALGRVHLSVATGTAERPDSLAAAIRERLGIASLAFYDADGFARRSSSPRVSRSTTRSSFRRRATIRKNVRPRAGEGWRVSELARFTREQYERVSRRAHRGLISIMATSSTEVPYFEGLHAGGGEDREPRVRDTLRFGPMKAGRSSRSAHGAREAHAHRPSFGMERSAPGRMWNHRRVPDRGLRHSRSSQRVCSG